MQPPIPLAMQDETDSRQMEAMAYKNVNNSVLVGLVVFLRHQIGLLVSITRQMWVALLPRDYMTVAL